MNLPLANIITQTIGLGVAIVANALIILVIGLFIRRLKSGGATYVLTSWAHAEEGDAYGNFVVVKGREAGVVSWILGRFGIEGYITLLVTADRIEFSESSLFGDKRRLIPLSSVSSMNYGYSKPWLATVLLAVPSLFCLIGAFYQEIYGYYQWRFLVFIGSGFFAVLFSLLPIAYYALNKAMTIGFIEDSGVVSGIRFKRSVIEGKRVDETQAMEVCNLVQRLIESRCQ